MERLQKAADEGLISAYYWRVLMDMSKKVLENIARKYDNVKEGVEKIMGGHVLEHEARKSTTPVCRLVCRPEKKKEKRME